MKLYLIRHGKTAGNLLGRYIGTTDEPLCEEGKKALRENLPYPAVQVVYTSSLKRTRETAEILYPGIPLRVREGFNECDFGKFENKNYRELSGDREYQAWVDSGGILPFPEGESREEFTERTLCAFSHAVKELLEEGMMTAALVVHGGSIMSILDQYGFPEKKFYEWQVKNGHGFSVHLDEKAWMSGDRKLIDIRSIL